VRDVDPGTQSFECDLRLFFEYLDPSLIGRATVGANIASLWTPEFVLANAWGGHEVLSSSRVLADADTGLVKANCRIQGKFLLQLKYKVSAAPAARHLPHTDHLKRQRDKSFPDN
jgi:hypothetical protein